MAASKKSQAFRAACPPGHLPCSGHRPTGREPHYAPIESFQKHDGARRSKANNINIRDHGVAPLCRSCKRAVEFYHKHKIVVPPGLYERLFAEQDGRCAICGTSECSSGAELCLDHCHKTGEFRGLLCHRCNTTIGRFNDDPKLVLRAFHYLTRCKP